MTNAEKGEGSPPARNLPLWPLLLILLMLGFAIFGEKGVLRVIQSGRQLAALEEDVRRLEETNASLRKEIESLRGDRGYIENIARRELGMVKEDEIVYQFQPHPPSTQTSAVGESPQSPDPE